MPTQQKSIPVSFDNTEVAFSSKSNKQLKKAKFLFSLINSPSLVGVSTTLADWTMRFGLPFKWLIRSTIFDLFVGGESLKETEPVVQMLGKYGIMTMLDHAVEAKETEKEFEHTLHEILKIIDYTQHVDHIPVITLKISGLASNALLEKMTAGTTLSPSEQKALEAVKARLVQIGHAAQKARIALYVDAEESWVQTAIDDLVDEMMAQFNKERPVVFNTVQLYRHDRLAFLKASHEKAVAGNYFLGIKLVRGAYMEKERERAAERGYPSPIQPNKAATDHDFNAAIDYCMSHLDRINFCAATHNEESCKRVTSMVEVLDIAKDHPFVNMAQLYGMSDHISFNLAELGYNVGKYVPYGPVRDVIPYLIRRAEENTSIAGQMSRELTLLQKEIARRKRS